MRTRTVIRRGLVGGGVATLLLAGTFLVALGTAPSTFAVVGWLAAVGAAMVAAGRRERIAVGPATLEWPRLAAVAIALLAAGWAVGSAVSLYAGAGLTGLGSIEIVLTVAIVGYFAWFARECWVGGGVLDEETFAVE